MADINQMHVAVFGYKDGDTLTSFAQRRSAKTMATMPLTIRVVPEADAGAVAAEFGVRSRHREAGFERRTFIAIDGSPVGLLVAWIGAGTVDGCCVPRAGLLDVLQVTDGQRRGDIGEALMSRAESWFSECGVELGDLFQAG